MKKKKRCQRENILWVDHAGTKVAEFERCFAAYADAPTPVLPQAAQRLYILPY
jgi:hypothetical protein